MSTTEQSTPRPYRERTGSGPARTPGTGAPHFSKGKKPPFKKRMCRLCDERKGFIDWKAINYIRSFVTDRGKMLAGRSKGTCAGCQRQLSLAIKRARYMALLPTSPVF